MINQINQEKGEIVCNYRMHNETSSTPENITQVAKLYYHNDHLGSTSILTNQSGAVVEQTFYEPFGGIIAGGNFSRYDYEGREFDSLVGDYDFRFRKYDPQLKIFTQGDAGVNNVYDPQELNRYTFEKNNPYKYVDKDGKTADLPPEILSYYSSWIADLIITAQIKNLAWKAEENPNFFIREASSRAYGLTMGPVIDVKYRQYATSPVTSSAVSMLASESSKHSIEEINRDANFGLVSIGLSIASYGTSDPVIQFLSRADTFSTISTGKGAFELTYPENNKNSAQAQSSTPFNKNLFFLKITNPTKSKQSTSSFSKFISKLKSKFRGRSKRK
jgi:RHS repeat-associated protein